MPRAGARSCPAAPSPCSPDTTPSLSPPKGSRLLPPTAVSQPPLRCPRFCLLPSECHFHPRPSPSHGASPLLVLRTPGLAGHGHLSAPQHCTFLSRKGGGGGAVAVLPHGQPCCPVRDLGRALLPSSSPSQPLPGGDRIPSLLPPPGTGFLQFLLCPPAAIAPSSGFDDWNRHRLHCCPQCWSPHMPSPPPPKPLQGPEPSFQNISAGL